MSDIQKFHSLKFVFVEAEVRDVFEALVVEMTSTRRRSLATDRRRGLERVVVVTLKSGHDHIVSCESWY